MKEGKRKPRRPAKPREPKTFTEDLWAVVMVTEHEVGVYQDTLAATRGSSLAKYNARYQHNPTSKAVKVRVQYEF